MADYKAAEATCGYKQEFQTKGEALEHIKKLKNRAGKTLVPYKCSQGDHFHVTGAGEGIQRMAQGRKPRNKNHRRKIR